MKAIIFNMFKNRTAGFWVSFGAGVLAILSAIIYIATDFGDPTFSTAAFALVLVAGFAQIALLAFDSSLLLLIPVALIAAGCGLHIYAAVPPITDIMNGVNLYNGNGELGIVFIVLFVLTAALATAGCFMAQRKTVDTSVKTAEATENEGV